MIFKDTSDLLCIYVAGKIRSQVELVILILPIVNLGTGYETLGISKAGTMQSQLDVEPTVTLHNLLFLVSSQVNFE